jgi:DNA polymerase delta subunit 4
LEESDQMPKSGRGCSLIASISKARCPAQPTFHPLVIELHPQDRNHPNLDKPTKHFSEKLANMPATRRTRVSSGPAIKGSQKTLAFGNKVTKPTPASTKEKAHTINPKTIDVGHVSSEAAVAEQARVEVDRSKAEKTAEEERASKITDAQIRRYWKEREAERKAPRVHQEDVSVEEKVLRLFDMSSQFGVCLFLHSPLFLTSCRMNG